MEEVHNPVETELAKKEKSTSMDEFLDKFSIVLDQQNPESAADLMNTFKKVMEEKEKENDELRVNNQFLAQTLQFKENALNNINQGVNAIQADPEDLEKAVEHVKKGALEYRKGIEHFYNVTLADVITKSHNSEYESGQKKYGQPDWETRQNNLKEWQNIAEILPPSVNKIDLEEHIELASKLPTLQNKLNTLKFMRDEHLKGSTGKGRPYCVLPAG
ncbi:MAG: hypothetical protein MUF12_08045 [Sediminibacterium sp.]|nr:hypothetical protein [Sediminibacterium sp.]